MNRRGEAWLMAPEAFERARIQLSVLKAVFREQAREASMEVYDAYTLMAILSRGAQRLSWHLRIRRDKALVQPVRLVSAVLQHQVQIAQGKSWFTPFRHGLYGWDPSREWHTLPSREAVETLREELQSIAETLVSALEFLPEEWEAALSRCAGALLLVAARLRDALEGATPGAETGDRLADLANLAEKVEKNARQSARQYVTVCDGM